MLTIEYPSIFKKDYKRAIKRGCNPKNFEKVVQMLQNQQPLPKKYHDHASQIHETSRMFENVILNLTGCLYTRLSRNA